MKRIYCKEKLAISKERRKFLKTAASAAAIGTLAYALPFSKGRAAAINTNPNFRVCIISGGLGGLASADALIRRGVTNITIYEANDHVASRCSTIRPKGADMSVYNNTGFGGTKNQTLRLIRQPGWRDLNPAARLLIHCI